MSNRPECEINGCTSTSEYLLSPEGNLCKQHAAERHPDTVAYLKATLGTPSRQEL